MVSHVDLGWVLTGAGRFRETIAELSPLYKDGELLAFGMLAFAYGKSGDRADARRVLEELIAKRKTSYVPALWISKACLGAGDRDCAIEWLNRVVENHDVGLMYLGTEFTFDELRRDARFDRLLRAINSRHA